MPPAARARLSLVALLALIAAVYIATLRPGHRWGDDFAMYIHHAANIASGAPYADTGYIYNPAVPTLGPQSYPPGLPLLLAPIYKLAGLNLTAMKLLLIAFSVLALAILYRLLEDDLPPAWRLALIAVLALNASALDMKDDIASEPPFLFFAFLALLLLKNASPRILAICAAIIAACAVRSAGLAVAVTPAVLFAISLGKRPKWPVALAATLVPGLYFLLQTRALAASRFVGGMFEVSLSRVRSNLFELLAGGTLRQFWLNTHNDAASKALYVAFLLLCAWGIVRAVRKGPGVIEAFCLSYAGVLAFYNGVNYRLILPVLPFLLAYAMTALRTLTANRAAIAFAALCVVATGVSAISAKSWGPIREGIADDRFLQLCTELQKHPSAPVLFRKPRLLSLLTGRPAAAYTLSANPDDNLRLLQNTKAGYVVRSSNALEKTDDDARYLVPLLEKYPQSFAEIYRNPGYALYRVNPAGMR